MNLKKINRILLIIVLVILASSAVGGAFANLHMLALIILIYLICSSNVEDSVAIFIGLIPYNNVLILNGFSIRGIIYLLAVVMLFVKRKVKISKEILISSVVLFGIEFINDMFFTDIFSILNLLFTMLYFVLIIDNLRIDIVDKRWVLDISIMSFMIAMIESLIKGGGIQSYVNDISYYRFGQESTVLGGAMAIPIYAGIIIAISFIRIVNKERKMWINILLISTSLLFGIMTVSRNFIVIILAIIVFVLIWQISKGYLRFFYLDVVLLGVLLVGYYKFQNLIDILFGKFVNRISGGESARFEAWFDSLDYLFTHVRALFFGNGCISYPLIGERNNLAFSMMTHNLYLDAVMSWGLIGLIALCVIIYRMYIKWEVNITIKTESLYLLPLIVYAVANLTEGSFNYSNTYMYILLIFLCASCQKKGNNSHEENRNTNIS